MLEQIMLWCMNNDINLKVESFRHYTLINLSYTDHNWAGVTTFDIETTSSSYAKVEDFTKELHDNLISRLLILCDEAKIRYPDFFYTSLEKETE